MTIRIFIVEDHALVRTGMRMILSGEIDIEVVGEAESGELALPLIRTLKPDVVLCDLHLPGISGLEVTERVVRGGYGARMIIVSALEDGPLPRRLLDAGAVPLLGMLELSIVVYGVSMLLFFSVLKRMDVTQAILGNYLLPFFIALLGV